VAIHTRSIPSSRVKAKRIASIRFTVCAAPSYLEGRRQPGSPTALTEHNCLVQPSDPIWAFGKGKVTNKIKVPKSFSSNSYLVLRTAALKGLGIALLPYRMISDELEQGELVELLKANAVAERPLYAAFAPGGPPPEKVHSLITYLSEWFRKHPL
jgi:DNA-binding transcriptional LysR family regulator